MLNVLKKEKSESRKRNYLDVTAGSITPGRFSPDTPEVLQLKTGIEEKKELIAELDSRISTIRAEIDSAKSEHERLEQDLYFEPPRATKQQVEAIVQEIKTLEIEAKKIKAKQIQAGEELPALNESYEHVRAEASKKCRDDYREVGIQLMDEQLDLLQQAREVSKKIQALNAIPGDFGLHVPDCFEQNNNFLNQYPYMGLAGKIGLFARMVESAKSELERKKQLEAEEAS